MKGRMHILFILFNSIIKIKRASCKVYWIGDTDSSLHGQFATDSSLRTVRYRTVRYMDRSLHGQFATWTVRYGQFATDSSLHGQFVTWRFYYRS